MTSLERVLAIALTLVAQLASAVPVEQVIEARPAPLSKEVVEWLGPVAQNCRPKDAVPNGSYKNSCHSCEIQGCQWLVCICDGKRTSLDMNNCPSNIACNNHGNLQCGEC